MPNGDSGGAGEAFSTESSEMAIRRVADVADVAASAPAPATIVWEADMAQQSWWRPHTAAGPSEQAMDQEFGEADPSIRRAADRTDRSALSMLDGGVLRIRGQAGKTRGIIIPAKHWADVEDEWLVLGLEMQLHDLKLPGYYQCPRIAHGEGRGTQRFFQREIKDWEYREFIFKRDRTGRTPLMIAHTGSGGDWLIRRAYIRRAAVDDAFPWQVAAAESATPLRVEATTTRATPANPLLHGVNPNLIRSTESFDGEGVTYTLEHSGTRLLRFPAGTIANWYEWDRDGWPDVLPDHAPQMMKIGAEILRKNRDGVYGFPQYVETTRRLGIERVIVLNINQDPETLVRWIRRMRELDALPRHFELGNEIYHWRQSPPSVKSAADYIEHVRPIAEAVRAEVPGALISLAAESRDTRADGDLWNRTLGQSDLLDGVTIHNYTMAFGVPFNRELVTALLYPEVTVARQLVRKIEHFGDKRVWLTEWGANAPPVAPTESHLGAMHLAGYLLTMADWNDHFEMAALHSLSRGEFSPVDLNMKPGGGPAALKRPFFAMQMMSPLFEHGASWLDTRIDERGLPPLEPGRGRAIARVARANDGALLVAVINRLPVAKPLDLVIDGRVVAPSGVLRSLSADRLSANERVPQGETLVTETRLDGGACTLPPFSINLLRLDAAK